MDEPPAARRLIQPRPPLRVARVGSGMLVRITLARRLCRIARRELSGREVGIRRSNPLLQLFNFQPHLVFLALHLISPPSAALPNSMAFLSSGILERGKATVGPVALPSLSTAQRGLAP